MTFVMISRPAVPSNAMCFLLGWLIVFLLIPKDWSTRSTKPQCQHITRHQERDLHPRRMPTPSQATTSLASVSNPVRPTTGDQLKLLQDLKSEAGNIRATVQFILNHLTNDLVSCAKSQKLGHSDKPPKAQASLASAQQGQGKKKKQAVISFPRNYVTQLDSDSESGSSDVQSTHHAMFARELSAPKLTLEQTYGPMPRRVFINREGKARKRDNDPFGFHNPRPFLYEGPADYWNPKHDRMNAVDDDRSPTTSPKPSMVSSDSAPSRACL
jgi:hypothetical protein